MIRKYGALSCTQIGFYCKRNSGRSLVDLLVGLFLAAILTVLLTVHAQHAREISRRTSCQNNLRHIGLAIMDYHHTFDHLPPHGTGTYDESSAFPDPGDSGPNGTGGAGGGNNGRTLSFLVAILPQLGHQFLWESIDGGTSDTVRGSLGEGHSWHPMGPGPSQRDYRPWVTDLADYRCPSDPRDGTEITGRSNYAACLGDAVDYQMESSPRFNPRSRRWRIDSDARKRIDASARGTFVYREKMRFSDITDGLAGTILVGEIATYLGDWDARTKPALKCGDQNQGVPARGGIFESARTADQYIDYNRPRYWFRPNDPQHAAPPTTSAEDENRGLRWFDARAVFTGFTTISPPNCPLQVEGNSVAGAAVASVSSQHHGGAYLLMADGTTRFVMDSIESGNMYDGSVRLGMSGRLAPGSPSPYGAWGEMGTRASQDNH